MTDEPKDDLRACPFCRGEFAPIVVPWKDAWSMGFCSGCSASGPVRTTEADAIAAWNTRPEPVPSADLARQVEVLREALSSILADIGTEQMDGYYDGVIYHTEVEAAQAALAATRPTTPAVGEG